MNATSEAISLSERANRGIPFSGRPLCTTGPILLPLTSSATSFERVRSGPVSPPPASRPWQKAQFCRNSDCPLSTCAGGKLCAAGLAVCRTTLGVSTAGLLLCPAAKLANSRIATGSAILRTAPFSLSYRATPLSPPELHARILRLSWPAAFSPLTASSSL